MADHFVFSCGSCWLFVRLPTATNPTLPLESVISTTWFDDYALFGAQSRC